MSIAIRRTSSNSPSWATSTAARFSVSMRPRVGLLSIGEEECKGNELTREAFKPLKQLPLNFVGNVEGRDLYIGQIDVIVADGFVGNVALKTSEGVARLVRAVLKESLNAPSRGRSARCFRATHFPISRSGSTTPNTVARRCWE